MQLRRLGSSGLLVSPICLGTMTFGSPVEKNDAIRLVHGAIDLGVNFIDTANVYEGYNRSFGSPGGVAEEILGEALKDRRDRVVVATKVGAPNGPGPQDAGLTASTILRELEASLERLKMDYVDLYIIHWPDAHTPMEVPLSAMETALRQGKIAAFGVSNHNAWQLCKFLWLADKNHWPTLVSSQVPFSMLRRHYQNDLEFCDLHNIGVTPYQALQGGLLTGKYKRGKAPSSGSRMAENPGWIWQPTGEMFDQIEATEKLACELNVPMSQYTVAWTLAQPAMTSLICGAKNLGQIEDVVKGAEHVLPEAILLKQDSITPSPPKHVGGFRRPTEIP